jgi:bifunctional non-homologous end joining protein LigD
VAEGFRRFPRARGPRGSFWPFGIFPLAAAAVVALSARSFLIDGEAIACDDNGLAVFEMIRHHHHDVELCAFDLLELDGEDLRPAPIEERKRTLARLLRRSSPGIVLNEHFSRGTARSSTGTPAHSAARASSRSRLGRPTAPGRQDCWVKVKNPAAPAVKREAEEDWA